MSDSEDNADYEEARLRDAYETGCGGLLGGWATQKDTGQRVHADNIRKPDGPFYCSECPGRLRASHAVCLASRTLEPAFCAQKEGADIESVSTTDGIFAES